MSHLTILDVGSGKESVAQVVFGENVKTVIRLDADPENNPDYVHDIREPLPEELHGKFDIVYASHVLEHIPRRQTIDAMRNLAKAVKEGGELWAVVPSLEWVAEQVYRGRYDAVVLGFLHGGQENEWDYHRCSFTMVGLRQLVSLADLVVRKAYQSIFTMYVEGKPYQALQNIVIGLKHGADPASAIE